MLRRPLLLPLLLFAAGLTAAGLGRAVGLWGPAGPPGVPRGDQEIAWIHAATSGSSWERFVAGVHRAARDWPGLQVDDTRAFLDQTTATPEVVLGLDGCPVRLMEVYPGRSFRFCFTDEQMAQAVVDFVWSRPELRPYGNPLAALSAVGAAAAGGWAAPAPLAVQLTLFPPAVTSFEWDDDPY